MLDMAGLAPHQVTLEHVAHFPHVAGIDQEAREVRPADQPLAGHEFARTLVGVGNSRLGERLADAPRALRATGADRRQAIA